MKGWQVLRKIAFWLSQRRHHSPPRQVYVFCTSFTPLGPQFKQQTVWLKFRCKILVLKIVCWPSLLLLPSSDDESDSSARWFSMLGPDLGSSDRVNSRFFLLGIFHFVCLSSLGAVCIMTLCCLQLLHLYLFLLIPDRLGKNGSWVRLLIYNIKHLAFFKMFNLTNFIWESLGVNQELKRCSPFWFFENFNTWKLT